MSKVSAKVSNLLFYKWYFRQFCLQ